MTQDNSTFIFIQNTTYVENKLPFSSSSSHNNLLEKYKKMIDSNNLVFFDTNEFEGLIDHFMDENDFESALNVISIAKEQHPFQCVFEIRKAQILGSLGKIQEAIKLLNNIESYASSNEELFLVRASLFIQRKEHNKAISDLEKVLEKGDEPFVELYVDLALQYENLNNWDKAIETLKKGLFHFSENEALIYEITFAFEQAKQNAEGVKYFKQFLKENPYSCSAWFNLGNLYSNEEYFDLAIKAYDYCITIDDQFSSAYFNKANAQVNKKNYNEALSLYLKTLEMEGKDPVTLCYIGECYEKIEDFQNALFYFNEAIQNDKSFDEAWFGKGIVYDALGFPGKGLEHIKKAIDLNPFNEDFWYVYAAGLKKNFMLEEAIEAYKKAAEITLSNYHIYIDLGLLLIENKKWKEASELFLKGNEKINNLKLKNYHAACLFKMHGLEKSKSYLHNLNERNELIPEILIKIAPEFKKAYWLINLTLN